MDQPKIDETVISSLQNFFPSHYNNNDKAETLTELSAFVRWFENAINEIGQPNLSWQLGQQVDYRSRGLLGDVVMNAGSLGASLHWLCKFYPLIQDATRLKLEVSDEVATLSYQILDPTIWPRHQDTLYSLGVFSTLIRAADPDIWSEVRIALESPRSALQQDVSRIVHAPVTYDSATNSISFPKKTLDLPLGNNNTGNPEHIQYLSKCLARKNRAMSVASRARYVIFSELLNSRTSQEHVARSLALSSRTLRRKLSQEGLAYQELLDECRMELAAKEFATAKELSFSQMALKLGYSEHSTFTRAFGRWSGMAPRIYRDACLARSGQAL